MLNPLGVVVGTLFASAGVCLIVRFIWRGVRGQRPIRSILRGLVVFPSLAILIVAAAWVLLPCGVQGCRLDQALEDAQHRTVVVDRYGTPFGVLEPGLARWVPLESFPPFAIDAVLAAEDARYWSHSGVDLKAVARAVLKNLLLDRREGASTVAQQVAQLVVGKYGSGRLPPDGTLRGKLAEVSVGWWLISRMGKKRTLEIYLNCVPLGPVYGFEAAALRIFGDGVEDLSLPQAATLAAMIRAPSRINPLADPAIARTERDRVLDLMEKNLGYPQEQIGTGQRVRLVTAAPEREPGDDFLAALRRKVRSGEVAVGRIDTLRTPFDLGLDTEARRELKRVIQRIERGDFGRYRHGRAPLQGIFVALDAQGGIRAYVGARPDETPTRYDRIADGRIRLSSTLKPVLLAAAIELQLITVDERLSSVAGRAGPDLEDRWIRRIRERMHEDLSVRVALARSENWLAVILWELLPAHSLRGLDLLRVPSADPVTPAEALGTRTIAPIDLLTTYTSFANGGVQVAPAFTEPGSGLGRIWSAQTASQISRVLRHVMREGTGSRSRAAEIRCGTLAAKTGTAEQNQELLIVGFLHARSDTTVSLLWVGNDKPRRTTMFGEAGLILAPAWARIMKYQCQSCGRC